MRKRTISLILGVILLSATLNAFAQETATAVKKLKVVPSLEALGKVYLMWEQVENTFYYNVYRDGKVVGRARDPFYVDKKATAGVKAVYKVAATKGGKEGAVSAEVSVDLPSTIALPKERVEFRGDDIYVNGEKYVVCGVGYAPYRPHTSPNKPYPRDYDLIEKDMQLIKKTGFNTLRTWSGRDLDEYMLELAHKYGFMVIQGMSIWVPPMADFADKSFQENSMNNVEDEMRVNREHNNILGYLLMNEPPPGKISAGGLANTNDFYARVTARIKELQPGAMVSLANWPRADMLDTSKWDFVCINHYRYDKSHSMIMGYRGYLGWMKRTIANGKPLMGTEYGYSMSKRGEGNYGYGGNTEEEQATGIVKDTYDMISEKGDGACIFSYVDEWWKNNDTANDEDTHDPTDPEEWFGIVGMPDDVNLAGTQHQSVAAMDKFYEALIINPKDANIVAGVIPVEVYTKTAILDNLAKVEFTLDGSTWQELANKGHWWTKDLDTKATADGKYDLKVRYTTKDGRQVDTQQSLTVYINNTTPVAQQKLAISTGKPEYKNGDTVNVTIKYTEDGKPVANAKVQYGIVQIGTITASCRIMNQGELTTDANGVIKVSYLIKDEERPHFLDIVSSVPSLQDIGQKFAERIVVEANKVQK